jgi:hypothetical protein
MARGRPRKTREDVLIKSAEFVGWALGGLEREIDQTRERLAALKAQAVKLRERIGKRAASKSAPSASPTPASRRQRRREMSAEARRKISEAMRKRWAERRKGA